MTTPTALDPILSEPDPADRLDGLTAYLDRLTAQRERARAARVEALLELRAQKVTWRALSHRTGLAEFTLRELCRKHRDRQP